MIMMHEWRQEVNECLERVPVRRKPFLRRSLKREFLLCTDLPLVSDEEGVTLFRRHLMLKDWEVCAEGSLLQLRKQPDPPEVHEKEAAGLKPADELACLISLLHRHPGGTAGQEELFDLLKAAEAGEEGRLFVIWHQEWASRLRKGLELPSALLPWLLWIRMRQKEEIG